MQYPDRRVYRLLLLLLDLIALTAAFELAMGTRIALNAFYGFKMTYIAALWLVPPLGLILLLWIPVSAWLSLYRPRRGALAGTFAQVMDSVVAVTIITIVVTFFVRDFGSGYSRTFVVFFAAWSLVALLLARLLLRGLLAVARGRGLAQEVIAIAGAGVAAKKLAEHLESRPPIGVRLCGVIAPAAAVDGGVLGNPIPVLGTIEEAGALINRHHIDRIVAVVSEIDEMALQSLAAVCTRMGVALHRLPVHVEMETARLRVHELGDLSLFEVHGLQLTRGQEITKRVFDLVLGSALLVVAAPLLLALAAAIRLTSRGPALYVAPRVGRGGRHFPFYKFRSMVSGAEAMREAVPGGAAAADGHIFKMKEDPRVTSLGRFMRRYSLDELPQLLNVIKGEMSLVGPRPLPAADLDPDGLSTEHAFWARERTRVLPGITGLWQVRGRSDAGFEAMIRHDVEYARSWSVGQDLRILAETLPAILRGEGAY